MGSGGISAFISENGETIMGVEVDSTNACEVCLFDKRREANFEQMVVIGITGLFSKTLSPVSRGSKTVAKPA
jgi:hypothetical protein